MSQTLLDPALLDSCVRDVLNVTATRWVIFLVCNYLKLFVLFEFPHILSLEPKLVGKTTVDQIFFVIYFSSYSRMIQNHLYTLSSTKRNSLYLMHYFNLFPLVLVTKCDKDFSYVFHFSFHRVMAVLEPLKVVITNLSEEVKFILWFKTITLGG